MHFLHDKITILIASSQLQLTYDDTGLEAIIFTADGDMRQAINNLQSTHVGFGDITSENVFKVSSSHHLINSLLQIFRSQITIHYHHYNPN